MSDKNHDRTDSERLDWLVEKARERWLLYGGCYINGDLREWIDKEMENDDDH